MTLEVEGPLLGQSAACMPVLRALPHWFGVESANEQYERDIEALPTFLARDVDAGGRVMGFLTVKQHFEHAAEVLVLGVLPERHRQGIGRLLLRAAEGWLGARGVEYLQVKTLGPSRDDAGYARTRAFYAALGFRPLEEITTLWDASNPALVMVKRVGEAD